MFMLSRRRLVLLAFVALIFIVVTLSSQHGSSGRSSSAAAIIDTPKAAEHFIEELALANSAANYIDSEGLTINSILDSSSAHTNAKAEPEPALPGSGSDGFSDEDLSSDPESLLPSSTTKYAAELSAKLQKAKDDSAHKSDGKAADDLITDPTLTHPDGLSNVGPRTISVLKATKAKKRALHFLLPATQLNKLVCKTMFSAFINDYPSPVLLNFESVFRNAAEARFMKIAAIHRYLQLKTHDDDLVLIMDSYDTWFQLSFETLIKRYYQIQEEDRIAYYSKHNVTIVNTFDSSHDAVHESQSSIEEFTSSAPGGENVRPEPIQRRTNVLRRAEDNEENREALEISDETEAAIPPFQEEAIFGGDKMCWPNAKSSKACTNVPESNLPPNIYGPSTDDDVYAYRMRPRWLNSGNIIGPAKVLKEIYRRSFEIQKRSKAHFSDQLIVADIYGEQDLPIRIDFESYLFQTMTHSHSDVVFLYNDEIDRDEPEHQNVCHLSDEPIIKEEDISPEFRFEGVLNSVFLANVTGRIRKSDHHFAWNRVSGHMPVVLHFNGPKLPIDTWWNKMWWMKNDSPKLRLARLRYARRKGGAFVDDDGTKFKSFKDMCGKFDMFETVMSRFDKAFIKQGANPSLDPEPFRIGMDKNKSPSDILISLRKAREKQKEKEKEREKEREKEKAKEKEQAKKNQMRK
ncbi:uncharacterized protein V1516DRAFT_682487 [Lipomyces oligophaga]|uniref:uncharacterized protein n=1 Tax=Lipomyces oligophaga TaxID=45792 RepID=UPI0034CE3E13